MFLPNAWLCAQHSLYDTLVPTEFADLCNAARLSALVHFLWSLVLPLWLACEKRRIFRLVFFGGAKQQAENPSVFTGYLVAEWAMHVYN